MAPSSLSLEIALVIFCTGGFPPASSTTGRTFTMDLIHRDSIESPFCNHSMTFSQRLSHAMRRSFTSAKQIDAKCNQSKPSSIETQIIPDHGEYLLNISFGNPPHKVLAIADTGSDLSWIQCNPCRNCYNHTMGSLFNPRTSSTYNPLGCKAKICEDITAPFKTNCSKVRSCQFDESYADGSVSKGVVARESVTIGDMVLPNIIFGCASSSAGSVTPPRGGIVGLGGGDFSLPSQLHPFVPARFSYCLITYPFTDGLSSLSSKMVFGDIDFGNAVSTPIVQVGPKTFYPVTLEAISIANNRVNMSDKSISKNPLSKGNMIVDSGTTLTMLPHQLYKRVLTALKDAIKAKTIEDPQKILDLCYHSGEVTKMPKFVMNFEGADVELGRDNVFVPTEDDVICFSFAPVKGQGVYGNLAQQNFMVGFDLDNNKVYFKPTDCEKL